MCYNKAMENFDLNALKARVRNNENTATPPQESQAKKLTYKDYAAMSENELAEIAAESDMTPEAFLAGVKNLEDLRQAVQKTEETK